MLLNRKLQLMDSGIPLRATLIESAGTKFADAVFQTATGHCGDERSANNKMPTVAEVLTKTKVLARNQEIFGCLGDFLTVIDNAVYRRFGTRFPQDSKAIFAQTAVSQQFVPPLTVCLQSRFPAFESKFFVAHVRERAKTAEGNTPNYSQLRKMRAQFR